MHSSNLLPLSVVIVTQNEEKNIREALQSIRDASEIIQHRQDRGYMQGIY